MAAGAVGSLALASTAVAAQRTITVTLAGKPIEITLDVPAGTPLDDIKLPLIDTPIVSVHDGGPAVAPATPPAAGPPPASTPRRRAPKRARSRPRVKPRHRVAPPAPHAPAAPPAAKPRPQTHTPPSPRTETFAVSVPSFFIEKFRVPPFLLPIYQAAGTQYGVRWEVLAAINEIETDYGRNLNVSSAGARGWMQFMPATWRAYGVDANDDGRRDPYNPVDAIFAAARYLKAAGAENDIRKAVFAYNHADWYVDSVLLRARLIGGAPAELVGSLTGLTQGRFPVSATSRYASGKRAANIFARRGAAVVAVQDASVVGLGRDWVRIRDVFGNTYSYAGLATISRRVRERRIDVVGPLPRDLPVVVKHLRVGSRVRSGTVLGRIGTHVKFRIRPVGTGAPLINPKPILDGWKLLEASALKTKVATPGQVLLMTKAQLQRRVLRNPRIEIYGGGRDDIRSGQIDRRVLATLEFLAASGLKPTVSSLKGNHGYYTASGNVSEHSSGNAVDISKINGIPIIGHQGQGSITDLTIRRLLTLQGTVEPHQIISLMTYAGADNAISLPDHADHIHVGFRAGGAESTVLKPLQWTKLIARLGRIDNPEL